MGFYLISGSMKKEKCVHSDFFSVFDSKALGNSLWRQSINFVCFWRVLRWSMC